MTLMDDITKTARNFGQFSGHDATTVRIGPKDAAVLAAETVEILDTRTMRSQKAPTVEHILNLMHRGEVRLAGVEVIIDDRRRPGEWFFTNG